MCINCWVEVGSPNIVNEKTKNAAELITELYEQEDCGVGGYAHIVVDDWNLDDNSIDYCIGVAKKGEGDYENISEEGRQACLTTLNYLKQLSKEERYSAMAIHSNYIQLK